MMATILIAVALVFCYLLARERFSRATSMLAVAGVGVGSPVLWYFVGSADGSAPVRLVLGSIAAYGWVRASRGASPRATRLRAAGGIVAGIAATLTWLDGPLAVAGASLGDVLWSSRGGILANSPVFYLGTIGLILLWRVDRLLAVAGTTLLAATTALVAAHDHWWGWAYPAAPAFMALTPYVVCGVAAAVDASARLTARRPVLVATSLLGSLVLWNIALMAVAHRGEYHLGEPASFGDVGAAQARVLHDWIGHPASAPANLAYALANGVHPSAYDLLASGRLLGGGVDRGEIDIGERDGPFVGEGWHGAERDGGRSFRWATRSAIVEAPLDRPADVIVDVVVRPYQPPKAPPQQLTLIVNGAPQAPVTLAAGWRPATVAVPRAVWRSGVNRLELRFAYDAKPSDAGNGDGRSLAASVDTIQVRVSP
jgi:hypothetical protein